ncbi:uncharacterized protein LOC127102617 [Lathyrus oleraceus]|uniref:uncharacterized protein LOC127102617 n=1 Tax=Pisum sativum TaxID=3888 RepID=UPI0021CEF6F9|nr:uncharacterized protein LOC127102617 [Pisum sativum]
MICEKSDIYQQPIQKLKHDDIGSRKCDCPFKENELVFDMTLNMVPSKNILETLKWKILQNVSNIKKIYDVRVVNIKAIRGSKTEIKQLLKLVGDDHYVSRYIICEDGVIIRDRFWTHRDFIKLFNIFPNIYAYN